MHIVEDPKTESINWKTFYAGDRGGFPNWAHQLWGLLHDAAENVPCDPCLPGAINSISGIHDLKNIEIGKPIYNYPEWKQFVERVKKAEGRNPHLKHFREEKVEPASHFDPNSFRIVKHPTHEVRIGCPVRHFSGNRCTVGTRSQAILHPMHEVRGEHGRQN